MTDPIDPLKELGHRWRKSADAIDDGTHVTECSKRACDFRSRATELESVFPALEKALAEMEEGFKIAKKQLVLAVRRLNVTEAELAALRMNVAQHLETSLQLQMQLAALKEPMACGHPKACIEIRQYDYGDNVKDSATGKPPTVSAQFCTACEHERLALDKQRKDSEASMFNQLEEMARQSEEHTRLAVCDCKEPMACGHPKACWVNGELRFSEVAWEHYHAAGHCTACEHERLVRAAVLREAVDYLEREVGPILSNMKAKGLPDSSVADAARGRLDMLKTGILALIPRADQKALDAQEREIAVTTTRVLIEYMKGGIKPSDPPGEFALALDAHDAALQNNWVREVCEDIEKMPTPALNAKIRLAVIAHDAEVRDRARLEALEECAIECGELRIYADSSRTWSGSMLGNMWQERANALRGSK